MDQTYFTTLAHQALVSLADQLEASAFADELDIDLVEDVLHVELDTGQIYIINKHAPTQQIWLSSPVSGAHYFFFREETGIWETNQGQNLADLVENELKTLLIG